MNKNTKNKCKAIIEKNTEFKNFELHECFWRGHWEKGGAICICRGKEPFALYVNYKNNTVEEIKGYKEYAKENWDKLKIISHKDAMYLIKRFNSFKVPSRFKETIKANYIKELTYNDFETIKRFTMSENGII